MSQPIVKTLIDEQLDEIEHAIAIIGFCRPFNEVIGQPREMLVCDLDSRLATTMKRGYIIVTVRRR
jgi:hypothetical protein